MHLLTQLKRKFLVSAPVSFLIRKSKKILLPGLPLMNYFYDSTMQRRRLHIFLLLLLLAGLNYSALAQLKFTAKISPVGSAAS